jgi:hypothetical protein
MHMNYGSRQAYIKLSEELKLPKVLLALNMCWPRISWQTFLQKLFLVLLWTSCTILLDCRGARRDWSRPGGVLECVNGLWHSRIFDLIWSSVIRDHSSLYLIWSLWSYLILLSDWDLIILIIILLSWYPSYCLYCLYWHPKTQESCRLSVGDRSRLLENQCERF